VVPQRASTQPADRHPARKTAVERYRRAQLFEAADVAYRRAGANRDADLDAWENALADGLPEA
jgi:hypothetical protein